AVIPIDIRRQVGERAQQIARVISGVSRTDGVFTSHHDLPSTQDPAQAVKPLSTWWTVPLTKPACGLARNATKAPTSCGLPKRGGAIRRLRAGLYLPFSGFASVSIGPGWTEFTVMPRGPRSRAMPLHRP